MKKPSNFIADFDSTTSVFTSLANFLYGKGFNSGGVVPNTPKWLARLINAIPEGGRSALYKWSGWYDAFPADKIKEVDEEKLSSWVTEQYPKRKYPGVMMGSANGGGTYVCSALHIPFLPQTFLLPVRRSLPPDDLHGDIKWGREHAEILLKKNPHLQLHQMHDPVQDRLMVQQMAYFRIKKLSLGKPYTDFILNHVEDGGTLYIMECTLKWPAVRVAERHYFQSGGLGALQPGALAHPTPEIKAFLHKHNAPVDHWDVPATHGEMPEAEWGFLPGILPDIESISKKKRLNIRRITFEQPDDFSPFAADLYRWWYKNNGMNPNRLIAECFALLDPLGVQRKSCVPYWLAFNTEPSAEAFENYLINHDPFDEIYVKLMSNGIKSIGLTPVERWRKIIKHGAKKYGFLGMDEKKYPLDLGSYGLFKNELKREVKEEYSLPERMDIKLLEKFIEENKEKYKIEWKDSNEESH